MLRLQLHLQMKKLMKKYSEIYRCFGGDIQNVPDITDPSIRNPKKAKINNYIAKLEGKLSSTDEYMIQRTNEGLYKINIDKNLIYCFDNDPTPWMQSERWRNIVSM